MTTKQQTQTGWILDSIHQYRGDMLLTNGGKNGLYLMQIGNSIQIGKYHCAIANIGDATFEMLHEKQFENDREAYNYAFWEDEDQADFEASAERLVANVLEFGRFVQGAIGRPA